MIIDINGVVHEANMYTQVFNKKTEPNGKSLRSIVGEKLSDQASLILKEVLSTGKKKFFAFQYADKSILMLAMIFDKQLNLVLALRAEDNRTMMQRRTMLAHSESICQRQRAQKLHEIAIKLPLPILTD